MIRPMNKNDRGTFLIMTNAFYASAAVHEPVPQRYHAAAFDAMMSGDGFVEGYMLELQGKAVGYGMLTYAYSHEAGGMIAWVEELFVLPEYRSRGLGREFFAYLKTNVDPRVTRLRLEVMPDNVDAMRLYEKMGFSPLPYSQMAKDCTP